MIRAISIGSLTLDLFFQDQSLTIKKKRFSLAIGGKYIAEFFNQALGGGGANVAIGMSRAGIKTALWSEIGIGGVSILIKEKLEDEHISTVLLEHKTDFSNISTILLTAGGERTIISHRSHLARLSRTERVEQVLLQAKLFYLGNMPELSIDFRAKLLKLAKTKGSETFLNLGVKDCRLRLNSLQPLLNQTDCLLVNRYELSDILHIPANELFPKEINYFPKLGMADNSILVITDGEFGSYAQTKSKIFYQVAYKVDKIIDATGAGDAFTSGFLAGRFYEKPIIKCLQAGAHNSASVIKKVGAQGGLLNQEQMLL